MIVVEDNVKKVARTLRLLAELTAMEARVLRDWDMYEAALERAIREAIKQEQRTGVRTGSLVIEN